MSVFKVLKSFLILLTSTLVFAGKGFSGDGMVSPSRPPHLENINYPKRVFDKKTGLTITITKGFDIHSIEITTVRTIALKLADLPTRLTLERYCGTDEVNEFLKSHGLSLRVHSFIRESSNTLMMKERYSEWPKEYIQAVLIDTKTGEKFNAIFRSFHVRNYEVTRKPDSNNTYKAQLSCGGLMKLHSLITDLQGTMIEIGDSCGRVCKNSF